MAVDHSTDILRAAMRQFARECEQSLAELEAEHEARRQQVVRALGERAMGRLASRLAPRGSGAASPRGRPVVIDVGSPPSPACSERVSTCRDHADIITLCEDHADSRPRLRCEDHADIITLSNLRHSATRVISTSAAGSPYLVETVLDDGQSFRTFEPPRMMSVLEQRAFGGAARPCVPPLDMAKVMAVRMEEDSSARAALSALAEAPTLRSSGHEGSSTAASSAHLREEWQVFRAEKKNDCCLFGAADHAGPASGGLCAAGEPSPALVVDASREPGSAVSGATTELASIGEPLAHVLLDSAAGLVVLANVVTLGLESSYAARDEEVPAGLVAAEGTFLALYALELGVRLAAPRGVLIAETTCCVHDVLLIAFGLVYMVLASALGRGAGAQGVLRCLRVFRWLRLVRLWRACAHYRAPRMLCQAMSTVLVPALWLMAAFVVGLYVYAALGMELITPSAAYGQDYEAVASRNFGTLGDALLALLSAVTLGGVPDICAPLIAARPLLALYFGLLVAGGSVAVVCLVAAVASDTLARASSLQNCEAWQTEEEPWQEAAKRHPGQRAGCGGGSRVEDSQEFRDWWAAHDPTPEDEGAADAWAGQGEPSFSWSASVLDCSEPPQGN